MEPKHELTGIELVTEFLKHSPFARFVGLELDEIEPERVVLGLPFKEDVATYADVVHGGAIGTLIDVAATAAAWSGAEVSDSPQGATVAITTNFARAAHGTRLAAEARTLRRGRSLCYCEVKVTDPEQSLIATGSVVYKIG